jgi:peptidoglycan/xylan/chitin deacetylase (PgdA/CDA1 family)
MKRLQLFALLAILLVTSCSGLPSFQERNTHQTQTSSVLATATAFAEATATSTPTQTPTKTVTPTPTEIPPTPTITPTPWAVDTFSPSILYPGVEPVEYVTDTCAYLENRWGEGKAVPGTIVVPIMFHSILAPGKQTTKAEDITSEYFAFLMGYAKELGFETITTAELVDFLKENKAIPQHSMILILDDRRPDTPQLFMPYLESNDWTLTLAFPTTDQTSESLWQKIEGYVDTGRVEVESHGHNHIYIQSYTSTDVIEEEIYKPIEVIQERFGTAPQALVWPGGNFTPDAAAMAQEAGFDIGFTVYSRGPLMYNWIPLGEPERAIDDPLMVLPRAWSSAADVALNQALQISDAAVKQAEEVQAQEQLYYSLFCASTSSEGN